MKAININDSEVNYTDLIFDGIKTVETRASRSLDSLIGKRVGIIRTGCGPALLVGYVDITGIKTYRTMKEFRIHRKEHQVPAGSRFDSTGIKYGYILENPEQCEPTPVTAKGIVIRNI